MRLILIASPDGAVYALDMLKIEVGRCRLAQVTVPVDYHSAYDGHYSQSTSMFSPQVSRYHMAQYDDNLLASELPMEKVCHPAIIMMTERMHSTFYMDYNWISFLC